MTKHFLKVVVTFLTFMTCLCSCTGEELLFKAFVDIAERDLVIADNKITLQVPIITYNFWILEAYVEVSTSENMTNTITYNIEDAIYHKSAECVEYDVEFTGLNPSTKYYYRVVVRGFAGTDDFTGETSKISFQKHEFTTSSYMYTIYTSGFVDLGLSTKWLATNLGASFPTEDGISAGWGDPTGTLSSSSDSDYGGAYPSTNISGTSLDICTAMLGSNYRTPTQTEMSELLNNCTWIFSTYRGRSGWIVVGSNKKAIFLPGTDDDESFVPYWTATFNIYYNKPVLVCLYNGNYKAPGLYVTSRQSKCYFRPVSNE